MLREKAGLSQEAFAGMLNVTQGAICHWETGDTKPSLDKLPKLAQILGCTVDDLFHENVETKQED